MPITFSCALNFSSVFTGVASSGSLSITGASGYPEYISAAGSGIFGTVKNVDASWKSNIDINLSYAIIGTQTTNGFFAQNNTPYNVNLSGSIVGVSTTPVSIYTGQSSSGSLSFSYTLTKENYVIIELTSGIDKANTAPYTTILPDNCENIGGTSAALSTTLVYACTEGAGTHTLTSQADTYCSSSCTNGVEAAAAYVFNT